MGGESDQKGADEADWRTRVAMRRTGQHIRRRAGTHVEDPGETPGLRLPAPRPDGSAAHPVSPGPQQTTPAREPRAVHKPEQFERIPAERPARLRKDKESRPERRRRPERRGAAEGAGTCRFRRRAMAPSPVQCACGAERQKCRALRSASARCAGQSASPAPPDSRLPFPLYLPPPLPSFSLTRVLRDIPARRECPRRSGGCAKGEGSPFFRKSRRRGTCVRSSLPARRPHAAA